MKVANKISLSFLIVAILITLPVASFFYVISKRNLEKLINTQLESLLESKKHHIHTYFEMLKASIEQLSKSVVLENFLKADRQSPAIAKEAFAIAMKRLRRTKEASPVIYDYLLLDVSGKVIAATNKTDIGMDKSRDAFYVAGSRGTYIRDIYYSEQLKKGMLVVSTPFLDSETGRLLGVLAEKIDLAELNSILTDYTGLGQSGEMYIANKHGLMVTPSRFLKNTFLKQRVNNLNSELKLVIYSDYRGVKVLGAGTYLVETQWVLLAKIDREEAMQPLFLIFVIFINIVIFVPVAAYLLGVALARLLTKPIRQLHEGMEIIGSGNLDYKVATSIKDEIGDFARSFDKMTEDLKRTVTSVKKLNQEIVERKRVESSLRHSQLKVRAVFDQAFQFIGLMDTEGILIEANRAALDFAGIQEPEVLGKPFWETPWWTHSYELQLKLRDAIKKAAEGEFTRFEATHVAKDGSLHYVDFSLKPVKDETGKVIFMIPEGRDITERKILEEALKESRGELELRVKVRTAELSKANEDLYREVKERKEVEKELKERMQDLENFSNFAADRELKMEELEDKIKKLEQELK